MKFGPNDEDAFSAARDDLVARFEATPAGKDLSWVAAQVLDFKWGYMDGNLAHWATVDITEILLGLYPAKVMLDPEDLTDVPAGFAAFFPFLGDEGIISVGHAATLAARASNLTAQFHTVALDESNWSMGKRLWAQAQSEGVDITEQDSMQRVMDSFNSRHFEERDLVLGDPPGAPGGERAVVMPLPPTVLAPIEELQAAAIESVALRRLTRLVEFVGRGRTLTDKGNLKLADGKQLVELLDTDDRFDEKIGDRVFKTQSTVNLTGVDLTFRLAVESQLLKIAGTKVVPGTHVALVEEDPLEALYGAWLALLHQVGPTVYWYRNHNYGWDWYADDLDEYLVVLLVDLYRNGDDPIPDLTEDAWEHLHSIYDLSEQPANKLEFHRELVESSLRRAFDFLSDLGTVRVYGVEEIPTEYGFSETIGGSAGLTPLGMWAVQRLAARVTSAPVVGALRNLPATELLAAASDLPEAEAIVEIDTWVEHHSAAAAALLVAVLPDVDETGRGLAFRALLRIGPDATDAVDTLADYPELAPFVTVWRVDSLTAAEGEMDCAADPERFVLLLHAVIELWGPEAAALSWAAAAAGRPGLPAMLDQVWRVKLSLTEDVLAAIGGHHPDKAMAKAARKALFKYRSSN